MFRQQPSPWLIVGLIVLFMGPIAQAATIVVGLAADIISDDPARAQRHRETDTVLSLLYEPLIRVDRDTNYGPGLASSFRQLSDVQWEFEINPQYRVSARQVADALKRAFGRDGLDGLPSPATDRLRIYDAAAVSENRVVVQLENPLPSLPTILSQEPIAAVDDDKLIRTGPYNLERWDRGNRIVLTKQARDDNLPERIVFEVIPPLSERISGFHRGQLDVTPWIPRSRLEQLRRHGEYELLAVPGTRSHFIELNTQRVPFNDPAVRRALNLAIDIPKVLHDVYQGIGYVTPTIVAPTTFGYDHHLAPIGFDLIEAQRLLKEAGYPMGFQFELDTLPHRLSEAQAISSMWREIGVIAHIRVWPDWDALKAALLQGGRLAWTAEWDNTSRDPGSILRAKAGTYGLANYGGYSNPVLDSLFARADRAETATDRLASYQQAQKILRDDAVFIFGYAEEHVMAQRFGANAYFLLSGPIRRLFPTDSGGC